MDDTKKLIEKYLAGTCAPEERTQLLAHFNRYFDQQRDSLSPEDLNLLSRLTWASIKNQLQELDHQDATNAKPIPNRPRQLFRWLPYAAAVLLAVSATTWYYLRNNTNRHTQESTQIVDIAPGGNRATLTLADGSTITLSETESGIILDNERIIYEGNSAEIATLSSTDTRELRLTTPNGGIYQVTLPDGSKVWLNAASTLTYPSVFDSDKRVVTLSGEAYFEVAKDVGKPFRVKSLGQLVDVLGTTFNVSAYPDESETNTTLVTGSVRITAAGKAGGVTSLLLEPSEKAIMRGGYLTKQQVDAASEIAWRNGMFAFRSERLESIMNKVARWYDIDVELQDGIGDHTFTGTVSRYENISGVLETLALTNLLSFEIDGGKLIVKSK